MFAFRLELNYLYLKSFAFGMFFGSLYLGFVLFACAFSAFTHYCVPLQCSLVSTFWFSHFFLPSNLIIRFIFFFSLPMVFPYFPSIPFCIRIWRVDTDFGHSLNFKTYASMWRFLRRCFFLNIFVVQYFKFFFTFFISLSYFRCFCCWSIHHLKWK